MQQSKVYLKKAPIKEAVCSFSFNEKISINIIEEYKQIMQKKEAYDELTIKFVNLIMEGESPKAFLEQGIQLITKDKGFYLRLSPNNISIHQLGTYTRWSDFSNKVKNAWTILTSLKNITPNNVSLKKINSFSFSLNDNLSDFFCGIPNLNNNFFFFNNNFNLNYSKILENTNINANISLKEIIEKKHVTLDLSANTQITNLIEQRVDVFHILDQNNELLYNAFTSILTEKFLYQLT
jgi:uncharacterized protein (TIGR04255 family)